MLLSVLLSGAVLAVLGASGWALVYKTKLDRVDNEIERFIGRRFHRRRGRTHWSQVEQALQFVFGAEQGTERVILTALDSSGETLHRSDNWPEAIVLDALPEPVELPGPSERRRPPPSEADAGGAGSNRAPRAARSPAPEPGAPEPPGPDSDPEDSRSNEPPRTLRPAPPEPGRPEPDAGGTATNRPPRSSRSRWRGPLPPRVAPALCTVHAQGQRWRIGLTRGSGVTLALGVSLRALDAEMRDIAASFAAAVALGLVLIAAGGRALAARALRPIFAITRTVERITAKGLNQRIPLGSEDSEFERLISMLNQMMDRLERSFNQAVRFSADAAHELKTPLAILQGQLEQAIQEADAGSAQQRTCALLLEEVQRLGAIVRKLLLLSLGDAGELSLNLEPLDLSATLDNLTEDIQILAPGLTLERDVEPGVWVQADSHLIDQAVQNLIGNAIKYNRPNGLIRLELRRDGQSARFAVSNTGKPIPADEHDKIFDRFYRVDRARTRKVDGVGLGLSLAREIARQHSGDLLLARSDVDLTTFLMTLPLAAPKPEETSNSAFAD